MEVKCLRILLVVAVFLSSCLREELPVGQPNPGEVETSQVEMSSDYKYQVYFDLNTGEVVGKNLKVDWDLGFECGENGNHIILNTSKLMFAADSKGKSFSIKDTLGNYSWLTDVASGDLDSTALVNWSSGNVYIIDRGYNEKGIHLGFRKISVESINETSFKINFASMENSNPSSFTVQKDGNQNFINFSFNNNGEIVSIEPNKSSWDFCFTQYTEKLFDSEMYIPYLVSGVLLNRNQTYTVLNTELPFEEVGLDQVVDFDYSKKINGIGYAWKEYDFDLGKYTVYPEMIYIIKNRSGFFYKLRFIDFYNDRGENGSPKFEYQRL